MRVNANETDLHSLNRGFEWRPIVGPFRRITDDQARSFNEKGFFVLEDAFDPETIARLITEIDPHEARIEEFVRAQPGKRLLISEADGISFTIHLVRHSQFLREFSASQVFADLCHDLIGPDVRLYWDQAVYKKPEYPKHFPWHQDNGYTFIEPQAYLTCWIALTDATIENGCPWIIPGGHLHGTLKHRASEAGTSAAKKMVLKRRRFPSAPVARGVFIAHTASHRPECHQRSAQDLHPSVRA